MFENEKLLDKIKNPSIRTIFLAITFVISAVIGVIVDRFLSNQINNSDYFSITLFVVAFITLVYSSVMWSTTQKKIAGIEDQIKVISRAIGQKANVLPYVEGYAVLQNRYKQANKEILLLSKYVFDWENNKSIYDEERLKSAARRKTYATALEIIKNAMKKGNFKYSLVVQVPSNSDLKDVFPFDPIYKNYAEVLMKSNKTSPDAACLMVTEVVFPNTFVIVDQAFLYMEFEIRNPETGKENAPFVLTIDDPNSEMISELLRVHRQLEARATLLT